MSNSSGISEPTNTSGPDDTSGLFGKLKTFGSTNTSGPADTSGLLDKFKSFRPMSSRTSGLGKMNNA